MLIVFIFWLALCALPVLSIFYNPRLGPAMSSLDFQRFDGRTFDEALEFLSAHQASQKFIEPDLELFRKDYNSIVLLFRGVVIATYERNGQVTIWATSREVRDGLGPLWGEEIREALNIYTPAAFGYRGGKLRVLFRINYDARTKSMSRTFVLKSGHTTPTDCTPGINVGGVYR